MQITLIEANEILSSFDARLRNYTERLIKKRLAMRIIKASVTSEVELECSITCSIHVRNGRIAREEIKLFSNQCFLVTCI